jgi:hypothetical protein
LASYKSSFEWSHLEDSIGGLQPVLLGWRETEGGREENHTQVMGSTTLLVNRLHRGSSLFGELFYFSSCKIRSDAVSDAVAQNFVCFYKTKKFTLFNAKGSKIYLNLGGKEQAFKFRERKKT